MSTTKATPIPLEAQSRSWDEWNAVARIDKLPDASRRQAQIVELTVRALGRTDLNIIDVGCGSGWMCERLLPYGRVTGTDFVDATLQKARERLPGVSFVTGDIFKIDLPLATFDVIVSLEVLSHVADQRGFVARLAALAKPGGILVLATQNRPIYERWRSVSPPVPDRIRRWVDHKELRSMLREHFGSVDITSVTPCGDMGYLRFVNSEKINRIAQTLVSASTIERLKERAMLGNTLVAVAVKV